MDTYESSQASDINAINKRESEVTDAIGIKLPQLLQNKFRGIKRALAYKTHSRLVFPFY